jgi:S1-C subfamily serine protease
VILKGFVQGPSMGVVLEPDEVPRGLGLDGVMVRQVDAGGPAQTAGVRPMRRGYLGDLIVGVNSRRISNTQDFFKAMEGKLVGEDIVLSVQRAAADQSSDSLDRVDIQVQLGSKIL